MGSLFERIRDEGPDRRRQFIVDTFIGAYPDLMRADPEAWRGKFRKMAGSAFAYYRGSAAGFYADMADETDAFTNEKTGRVWIQGDLHAANFGTYMNSAGVLVFDVNDFDEAYVGPFTWDLKRLAASLTLIGYEKALSDDEIGILLETLATSYAEQVAVFAGAKTHFEKLRADARGNTSGTAPRCIRSARLHDARRHSSGVDDGRELRAPILGRRLDPDPRRDQPPIDRGGLRALPPHDPGPQAIQEVELQHQGHRGPARDRHRQRGPAAYGILVEGRRRPSRTTGSST